MTRRSLLDVAIKGGAAVCGLAVARRMVLLDLLAEDAADPACCTACGRCLEKCPQHVKIVDGLKNVAALVERVKKGGRG